MLFEKWPTKTADTVRLPLRGLFEVILPQENEKDLAEVPENLHNAMKLHFVDNMDQVLAVALEGPLPQIPSETETTMAPIVTPPAGEIPTARQ